MAGGLNYLKSLGLAVARGVPQAVTGAVDLAALPFTMSGLLKSEDAVGSTDWMTKKGLLPPPQKGLLNETAELVSGAINPSAGIKAGLLAGAGTLAGINAAKADLAALAKASQQRKAGASRDDLWQNNGWDKFSDGKWKWDINDKNARPGKLPAFMEHELNHGRPVTTNLGTALDHPDLYSNYSDLKNITVTIDPSLPHGRASMTPLGNGKFHITTSKDPNGPYVPLKVMLHEISHPVQMIEGFAAGTSPMAMGPGDFSDAFKRRILTLRDAAARSQQAGDTSTANALNARTADLYGKAQEDAYLRQDGEAAARANERRMNMDAQQRRQTHPLKNYDVPEKDLNYIYYPYP